MEETRRARQLRIRREVREWLAAEIDHLADRVQLVEAWPKEDAATVRDEVRRQVARLRRYS